MLHRWACPFPGVLGMLFYALDVCNGAGLTAVLLSRLTTALCRWLVACALLAGAGAAHAQLPDSIADLLRKANIPEDSVGALVVRLPDGATLLSHGANRAMAPASTMKLVTSLVVLDKLGPAYRGRTELRSAGETVDGALKGDLMLRGLANTDLDWEAFQRTLQTLRNKGVRDIEGDLIVDRSLFQPPRLDQGAPVFDETPEFRYNVIPDALLLNTNLIRLDIEATAQSLQVRMTPALDRVTVAPEMALVDRACADWEDGWRTPVLTRGDDGAIRIELQGDFPRNCSTSTQINVIDRQDFTERLFRTLWTKLGGTLRGVVREDTTTGNTTLLAEHRSRPLSEVVRDVNKPSDNPITRTLYLALGAKANGNNGGEAATPGSGESTLERAEREVRTWFKQNGIDDAGLVLENGSGLSRSERIKPTQLIAVLKAAARSNWAPEFMASLPVVAVDGTMRRRLKESAAAGRARVKTGTLKDVVAVAGYVPDAANQLCAVVMMINHSLATSDVARPIADAMVDWVARSRIEND